MSAALPEHATRRCRAGAWLALVIVAGSCDQSFRFDEPVASRVSDAGAPSVSGRCTADTDCALASLHCDRSIGLCFECVVDEDCAPRASRRCDTDLHRCVECEVERDCPTGSACDPATHRCLVSCVQRLDCDPSAHGCDQRRHMCIQCDDDRECGATTSAGYCAIDGTGCVECRLDSHCNPGSLCDTLSGNCVECRDSRDCGDGSVCDPLTHTCSATP